MASSYPSSLDSFTNPSASDALNSATVPHATQHANVNNAIVAIETTLGTNPQGSAASVKARLNALDTTIANISLTPGPTGPTGATGPTGPTGASGVIAVTSPITNSGTSTSATIGIDQTAFSQFGYRKFISGYNYYVPNVQTSGAGAVNPTLTRQWFIPLMVSTSTTFTRLGLYIVTGIASSTYRLGIYSSDSNDKPATLVVDAGTVSGATSATSVFATINTTLAPGLYWLSACAQGATGAGPRGYTFTGTINAFVPSNTSASASNAGGTWYQDNISGAFANVSSLAILASANVPAVTIGL